MSPRQVIGLGVLFAVGAALQVGLVVVAPRMSGTRTGPFAPSTEQISRDTAAGPMAEAVHDGLQYLAPTDTAALIAYLQLAPARSNAKDLATPAGWQRADAGQLRGQSPRQGARQPIAVTPSRGRG